MVSNAYFIFYSIYCFSLLPYTIFTLMNYYTCLLFANTVKYTYAWGIRNTDDSPLFRYKTSIYFLTFSFSTRGERDTISTMVTVPTLPTVNPPPSWTGPVQSQISTNCFFEITKLSVHRFRAWHHPHPSPISYLRLLLWHLWLSYPLRASVNCTQCVLHLLLH